MTLIQLDVFANEATVTVHFKGVMFSVCVHTSLQPIHTQSRAQKGTSHRETRVNDLSRQREAPNQRDY